MNQQGPHGAGRCQAFYYRARRLVLAGILSMLTVASYAAQFDTFDQVPTRYAYANGVTPSLFEDVRKIGT